jgi:hypothetical protein
MHKAGIVKTGTKRDKARLVGGHQMRTLERVDIRVAQAPKEEWADQLARHYRPKPPRDEFPIDQILIKGVAALWQFFDQARLQANAAFERAGVPQRIVVHHASNARSYTLVGPADNERIISVSINMPVVNDQILGGIRIGNSQSRQSISLMPILGPDQIQWQVVSLDRQLDAGLIQDLFLSVFGDDPMATARLSPLSGFDAFETPWS